MSKLSEDKLKAILASERADALAANNASKLTEARADAMDYYLGDVSKDLPDQDGRSRAVSMDVADTIEGMMPPLMEIFTGGDEVVRFEAVGGEDVEAAEQETAVVNHVFMQQNPGFMVLYSFIKDSLLSKNCIVKIWWEKGERETRETYYDQSDDTFAVLVAKEGAEVVEHTEKDAPDYVADPDNPDADRPKLHDVTIAFKNEYSCARVEAVPPEEFGISRRARSIKDTNYCFHEVTNRTEASLIADGYDKRQIQSLPTYSSLGSTEDQARDTVDENTKAEGDEGINKAARPIRITEHCIELDYEQNGKPALYQITTGGEDGIILKKDGEIQVSRIDYIPYACMTPVIITHRFFGRSIADLVMDIQRIKTAVLRALLDNAYLSNFPRPEIAQSHASDTTLDDLLAWRPGAPIRTKSPGGLVWQQVPNIGAQVYPLIQYMDATREWRTGVTRQGQGVDADALQNQTATAANQFYTAAQARIKLIARIFAETGIRDLFSLLHACIRKNGKEAYTVKLRNKWVPIDPRQWKTRNDMTINVGLGTGSKAERLQQLMVLISAQEKAALGGMTNLVQPKHFYNSAKELVKLIDLKAVDQYFSDPETTEAAPTPPDPKLIEIQMKAEIEKLQAQADIETQKVKTQSEIQLAQAKFEFDRELKMLDHQMKMKEHQLDMFSKASQGGGAEGGEGQPMNGGGNMMAPLFFEVVEHLRKASGPKTITKTNPDGTKTSWTSETVN